MKIEIPEKLRRRDIKFIRLAPKGKNPIDKEWSNNPKVWFSFDDRELLEHLEKGGNYGVLGGEGELLIIDSDNPKLTKYIEENLPKTLTCLTGSNISYKKHFYFKSNDIISIVLKKINKNGKEEHFGEIQGKGRQVVGISCIHPDTGYTYKLLNNLNITTIKKEDLEKLKEKFCTKGLLIAKKNKQSIKKFEDEDIENNLNVINIVDSSQLKKKSNSGYYFGSHPVHGSKTGHNFHIDSEENVWYCFRCGSGGGVASLIAVKEGLINCSEAKSKLKRDIYKKVLKLAEIKYGYVNKTQNKKESISKENINTGDSRKEVLLPEEGEVLVSEFVEEVSEVLKDKNKLFYRISSHDIVEVGKIKIHQTEEEVYTGFISVKPSRLITLLEKYLIPGLMRYNRKIKDWEFMKKSINAELGSALLNSEILEQKLPQIQRIFTVPYPIFYKGKLTFPKKGYDERFSSWLPYDIPEITEPSMDLNRAKEIIKKLLGEFCFKEEKDFIIAVAGLLTPFLRGLFPSFNTRTPIFFYIGNRERVGKDYLAGITGIVYEGYALEDPPVSYDNVRGDINEELRKKITAAFIHGRQRIHFSNCRGFINNAVLEHLATASVYEDRVLGKNDLVKFDNDICISLSGNVGVTFTPDFANRCRFINLVYYKEDANARVFKNPNLHEWVKKNRSLILSALFSLVKNWVDKGSKEGSKPFTSYPSWANVCGGIMESAGYNNPCEIDEENLLGIGGDSETESMKVLYKLCYEKYPNEWIKKKEIKEIVNSNDLFNYLDLSSLGNRSDQTRFGILLSKFVGRELSDIRLTLKDKKVQSAYQEFMFAKINHSEDKNG